MARKISKAWALVFLKFDWGCSLYVAVKAPKRESDREAILHCSMEVKLIESNGLRKRAYILQATDSLLDAIKGFDKQLSWAGDVDAFKSIPFRPKNETIIQIDFGFLEN